MKTSPHIINWNPDIDEIGIFGWKLDDFFPRRIDSDQLLGPRIQEVIGLGMVL